MTSTPDSTAPFATRSSITSLWSARQSRLKPSGPTPPEPLTNNTAAPNRGFSRGAVKVPGAGTNGARTQEAGRKRDEEAETWGSEASMGIGAGKPVKGAKADKDAELRGRILGKRRWEGDGKAGEGKEKAATTRTGDGDSDEDVGRSALGRKKKRRVEPARPAPREKIVESEVLAEDAAGADGEAGAAPGVDVEMETSEGDKAGVEDKSPSADNAAPAEASSSKRKRKNKNKKKKRKATDVE